MYEKITDKIISTKRFINRMFKHALYVIGFLALSLIVGALGFMAIEGYPFKDAILFSAHILAGLGIVHMPDTYIGRLFAVTLGFYSSLFFLAAFSVIAAPIVHRILHRMHLEDKD